MKQTEPITDTSHPQLVAFHIASELRSDRVAAAQVKEFIKPEELLALLGLGDYVEDIRQKFFDMGYSEGNKDGLVGVSEDED